MPDTDQKFWEIVLGVLFWFSLLAILWKTFVGKKSLISKTETAAERGIEVTEESIAVSRETNRLLEELIEVLKSKNL